jgi:hypothetical protein
LLNPAADVGALMQLQSDCSPIWQLLLRPACCYQPVRCIQDIEHDARLQLNGLLLILPLLLLLFLLLFLHKLLLLTCIFHIAEGLV